MMSRRLPPLNALRAFEAAARHLSFSCAAAELNVTQAAISHQVKALENHLGLSLFRRLNRALMLTDQGRVLFPAVRDALDNLAEAASRLRARDRRHAHCLDVAVLRGEVAGTTDESLSGPLPGHRPAHLRQGASGRLRPRRHRRGDPLRSR